MEILVNLHNKIKNDLRPFGYLGDDIFEARSFVEFKIAEYWVDTPPKYRGELEKEYAKKCSELKKIKKEITSFATKNGFRLIYDVTSKKYTIKIK